MKQYLQRRMKETIVHLLQQLIIIEFQAQYMFQPTHLKVTLRNDGYSTESMNDPVRLVGPMASTTNLGFWILCSYLVTSLTRQTRILAVYFIHMIFHLVIYHCNGHRRERICSYHVTTSNLDVFLTNS